MRRPAAVSLPDVLACPECVGMSMPAHPCGPLRIAHAADCPLYGLDSAQLWADAGQWARLGTHTRPLAEHERRILESCGVEIGGRATAPATTSTTPTRDDVAPPVVVEVSGHSRAVIRRRVVVPLPR